MKNFKDLVSEVAQPKAPEEKRFKDQHTIEVIKHPVALDSQFTGDIDGKTGTTTRPADTTNDEAEYDKAYKRKIVQTLPRVKEDAEEETNILKKSITEILGVNKKKKDEKKDDSMEENKVTCPQCEGKGCDHCDGKGFHIQEGGCSGDTLKAEKKPAKKAETKEDKVDAADNKDSLEPEAKPIKKPKVSPTSVSIKDSNGKTISLTFKEMLDKVSTEEELLESPQQEIPMMMKQLHFICYASQEIEEYLGSGTDPEEWWQNKLAEVFSNVKSLYAYAKGDAMVSGKPLGAAKIFAKAGYGEAFEAGSFDLEDATSIDIKEEDANLLNKMFDELTEDNTKEMYKVLVSNEAGFNEILNFAKENM